jgi:hypothetical protein
VAGTSSPHFADAALNAGDNDQSYSALGGTINCPLAVGSAKLGTPLARMHLENASGPDPKEPAAAVNMVVPGPVLGVLDAAALVLSTVAGVGPEELPPHPDTRIPLTSAAASKDVRPEGISRLEWMLASGLLVVSFAGAYPFYATDGFAKVSLLKPEATELSLPADHRNRRDQPEREGVARAFLTATGQELRCPRRWCQWLPDPIPQASAAW